jgi:acetyl-CoA carboxylase beta subunit
MMAMFKELLEKISPSPTNPKNKKAGADKKKKKCPHCGLEVYHKPEACFELEANAAKCPAGWTSKKNT